MKYFRNLLLVLLLCSAALADASTFSGVIIEQKSGTPMPFVTVSLLSQDSTLILGAITDDHGSFTLSVPDGIYILQISYIGYSTIANTITIPGTTDFSYALTEETEQLKEVEVKAKRPLVERLMDKIVLNVSQSPMAAGSNGKEILKRAPGVNIDKDGNVTVNGKSVEVYIDGRPSYLSGEQLKAMLEGTDGNTIEKIEIISNPSAKYDASGQGGIINIKTKRNMMKGLNGTLSAAYGGMYWKDIHRWLSQDFVSLNLNYRTAKTYSFLQFTQVYSDFGMSFDNSTKTPADSINAFPATQRYSTSEFNGQFQYYQLRLGNDWYIDDKNTFGFIFQAPVMIFSQNVSPENNIGWYVQGVDTVERTSTSTSNQNLSPQHSANINFTHVFSDSLDREITVNVDYNRFHSFQKNNMFNNYTTFYGGTPASSTLLLDINSDQKVDIYSAKADFQTKFWKTGMLETGVKWAMSNTFNLMTTDSVFNEIILAPSSSDFNYSEQVAAAYITAGKQFGEHWSVKLGLRGEYTYSYGEWISADSTTSRSYFNVFPTAFLGYASKPLGKLAQPLSANVSYTRRIKRPSYYQLNPFKTYVDAHSYTEGNTMLTPEFNNQVDISLGYSQFLSIAFNFSHTQDMFSQRVEILPNGDGRMQWSNFGTCTTHGGNLSLTELPLVPKYMTLEDGTRMKAGAWLSLTLNASYYHFINKSYDLSYLNKSHWGSIGGTLNSYLPKDWTLSFDCNWSAPMTNGYNRYSGSVYTGLGIRKLYMKKGLIFNLNVQDLLRTGRGKQENFGMPEGYEMLVNQVYRQQKVMFSLVYMFGKQQYTKQRKVGSLDETSRLGAGNATGMGK